jgi:HlyD family secretion protein
MKKLVKILKEEKVISAKELRDEKSKRINKEMSLPQINASIINNESLQNEKRKEIAELENQIQQQKDIFIQALNTFKSQVDNWKRNYLLIAPIDGAVSFSSFIQENQQLRQGQVVCYINPGNTNYYVEALISQYNFGKIKTGQPVLLKFSAYPYQEFGSVKGVIEIINSTPSDSGYMAKVSLPEGLMTNYRKQIHYKTGLSLEADIITENMNLLQRLFYGLRKNLSQ